MKLARAGNKVTTYGAVSGPQAFAISNSRIAFNILSSGLYNDKIRAVIRELSCNAWDAHKEARKEDIPFEIHLPTSYEPYFSVQDFGVGLNPAAPYVYQMQRNERGAMVEVCLGRFDKLTEKGFVLPEGAEVRNEDEVVKLYCTYFASSKNDSNEFIGAMGVGSKSPFCYCEGFTVVNRYNGTKRTYSASIGSEGTPEVDLMSEEVTSDPNGLEITFPVQEDDCHEFENKAKLALEFFVPRPKLNIGLDIPTQSYIIRTDKWALRPDGGFSGLRAVQGNVQYSVGNIDTSKMTKNQQSIAQMPLDIFFPIGQLQVAASREALQLDEKTRKNILKMLDGIYTGMLDEIRKKIEACREPWHAQVLIYSLSHAPGLGPLVKTAHESGAFAGSYKNFMLDVKTPALNVIDAESVHISRFAASWRENAKWSKKEHIFPQGQKKLEVIHDVVNGIQGKEDYDTKFPVNPETIFIVNDVKFGAEKYIHYFLQEAEDNCTQLNEQGELLTSKIKTVFLLSRINKDIPVTAAVNEAQAMMKTLGNPPTLLLSELKTRYSPILDARTVKSASAASVPVRDILELTNKIVSSSGAGDYPIKGWNRAWKRSAVQLPGKKFYVAVQNLAAVESGFDNAHGLTDFLNDVRKSGKFGIDEKTVIYGVKTDSKLRKSKDWVDLIPHLMAKVSKVMDASLIEDMTLLFQPFETDDDFDELIAKVAKEQPLAADSPFQIFAADLFKQKQIDTDQFGYLMYVLKAAKLRNAWVDPQVKNYNELYEAAVKQYPMLSIVSRTLLGSSSISSEDMTVLIDYLRTVDSARTLTSQSATAAVAGN